MKQNTWIWSESYKHYLIKTSLDDANGRYIHTFKRILTLCVPVEALSNKRKYNSEQTVEHTTRHTSVYDTLMLLNVTATNSMRLIFFGSFVASVRMLFYGLACSSTKYCSFIVECVRVCVFVWQIWIRYISYGISYFAFGECMKEACDTRVYAKCV